MFVSDFTRDLEDWIWHDTRQLRLQGLRQKLVGLWFIDALRFPNVQVEWQIFNEVALLPGLEVASTAGGRPNQ